MYIRATANSEEKSLDSDSHYKKQGPRKLPGVKCCRVFIIGIVIPERFWWTSDAVPWITTVIAHSGPKTWKTVRD